MSLEPEHVARPEEDTTSRLVLVGDPSEDPILARQNNLLGVGLFVFALVLFAATWGIGLIYLAVAD